MNKMTKLKTFQRYLDEGKSVREISRITGINRSTLRYHFVKLGLKSNYKQGQRSPNFKSEHFKNQTKSSYGYVLIKKRNHPNCDKQGYVRRSRLVMEESLGRFLRREEVVHHINGIKDDDRIQNLQLFPSDKEHIKFHMKGNKFSKKNKEGDLK